MPVRNWKFSQESPAGRGKDRSPDTSQEKQPGRVSRVCFSQC
ncbi:rCG48042, isoform CRA_b, partial [Rattus norvegicus]